MRLGGDEDDEKGPAVRRRLLNIGVITAVAGAEEERGLGGEEEERVRFVWIFFVFVKLVKF